MLSSSSCTSAARGSTSFAGRLVEQALRDGLDLWQLADAYCEIARERAEAHEDMQQRLEALMVLHLVPLLREHGAAAATAVDWICEDWTHQPITDLATYAPSLASALVTGGGAMAEPWRLIMQARGFVRTAQELGGIESARLVVEGLRARLSRNGRAQR